MEGQDEGAKPHACTKPDCDMSFDTAAALYGHMAHHGTKRKKGAAHHFVRKKYSKDPGKESKIRNKPIPSKRYKRGARRWPPTYEPSFMLPRPIPKEEPDTRSTEKTEEEEDLNTDSLETEKVESSGGSESSEEDNTASVAYPTYPKTELCGIMNTLSEWIKS